MADINDLNLKEEDIVPDYNEIPEEFGQRTPPPQPGTYVFKLPEDLTSVWEPFEANINGEQKQRIRAVLRDEHALIMSGNGRENEPFGAYISGAERPRGKERTPVSDLTYLVRCFGEKPRTPKEHATALIKHGGESFRADVEWSAYCNPKKDAYFEVKETDDDGNEVIVTKQVEGTQGCSENYYQQDIPRDEHGLYQQRFTCGKCGASLMAFPSLRNFKKATN